MDWKERSGAAATPDRSAVLGATSQAGGLKGGGLHLLLLFGIRASQFHT